MRHRRSRRSILVGSGMLAFVLGGACGNDALPELTGTAVPPQSTPDTEDGNVPAVVAWTSHQIAYCLPSDAQRLIVVDATSEQAFLLSLPFEAGRFDVVRSTETVHPIAVRTPDDDGAVICPPVPPADPTCTGRARPAWASDNTGGGGGAGGEGGEAGGGGGGAPAGAEEPGQDEPIASAETSGSGGRAGAPTHGEYVYLDTDGGLSCFPDGALLRGRFDATLTCSQEDGAGNVEVEQFDDCDVQGTAAWSDGSELWLKRGARIERWPYEGLDNVVVSGDGLHVLAYSRSRLTYFGADGGEPVELWDETLAHLPLAKVRFGCPAGLPCAPVLAVAEIEDGRSVLPHYALIDLRSPIPAVHPGTPTRGKVERMDAVGASVALAFDQPSQTSGLYPVHWFRNVAGGTVSFTPVELHLSYPVKRLGLLEEGAKLFADHRGPDGAVTLAAEGSEPHIIDGFALARRIED